MGQISLGVISTILSIISWFIFWWLSIIAIILGVVGLVTRPEVTNSNSDTVGRTFCIMGIIVGAIGLLFFIVTIAAL